MIKIKGKFLLQANLELLIQAVAEEKNKIELNLEVSYSFANIKIS